MSRAMHDGEIAYRVGESLAYLVRKMETFCGVAGGNVLMYKHRNNSGIPARHSAKDVLTAQAANYSRHRSCTRRITGKSWTTALAACPTTDSERVRGSFARCPQAECG